MDNSHHKEHDHLDESSLKDQHSSEMDMHGSHSDHVEHHDHITPPESKILNRVRL